MEVTMGIKTSNMHDALVAIASATVVTSITETQKESIELRGD